LAIEAVGLFEHGRRQLLACGFAQLLIVVDQCARRAAYDRERRSEVVAIPS
jgi:hypothetical protein